MKIETQVRSPLLEVLGTGIENATAGRELGDNFGMNGAEVRKEVHKLRRAGVPICACYTGYFMPKSDGELEIFRRQFAKRIAETQAAYAIFEKYATEAQSRQTPMAATIGESTN